MGKEQTGTKNHLSHTYSNQMARAFDVFVARSPEKVNAAAAIATQLRVFPDIQQRLQNPNQSIRLLYAGAGSGALEHRITRNIIDLRGGDSRNIEVVVEEPAAEMRQTFLETAKTQGLSHLVTTIHPQGIEDPNLTVTSADVVMFSHGYYYIPDAQKQGVLNKLTEATRERNGLAIVIIQSETSDHTWLRSHMYGNEPTGEEAKLRVQAIPNASYDIDIIESKVPIHDLFAQRHNDDRKHERVFDPSSAGQDLLSFLLWQPWEEIDEPTRQKVGDMFLEMVSRNDSPIGKERMVFRDCFFYIHPAWEGSRRGHSTFVGL